MRIYPFLLSFLLISMASCYRMRGSKGGGQIDHIPNRKYTPADVALVPGYQIESITEGLTFPTAVAFDAQGQLYVIEAGYCYGEVWTVPKLLRVAPDGNTTTIATGTKNGPWTGLVFHEGNFYVAEGGAMEGGKILKITPDGKITELVSNLPSVGDHHTNGPIIKDGYIYFGQGAATNSGVVGEDNAAFGWLQRKPDFHDIPCKDIVLNGLNYETENVLTEDTNDKANTGAFSPFNKTTQPGQTVKGALPCTGAIMRLPVRGGNLELVAWGLRNPYGFAVSPNGKLYVTENGYDDRGSRPVWGTGDVLWEVKEGMWYGWPDYSEGMALADHGDMFKVTGKELAKPLIRQIPNQPPKPAAIFGVHSSSNGIAFSTNDKFGYKGEAFVAQFGDMSPNVGKVLAPVGFKVVRVDVETGVVMGFAVNKGKKNAPASWLNTGGLERPVSVSFDPSGTALYVVDFGIVSMGENGALPQTQTGNIWKITRKE